MNSNVIEFPKRQLPQPPSQQETQSAYELMMAAQRIIWAKQAKAEGVAK